VQTIFIKRDLEFRPSLATRRPLRPKVTHNSTGMKQKIMCPMASKDGNHLVEYFHVRPKNLKAKPRKILDHVAAREKGSVI
jgi:hypothetical protein